jgi:xanthine dehydrogenase/oxidase
MCVFENFRDRHFSVNACLMPVLAADGCHVTTIEGIGSVRHDDLHPVQKAMVDFHGSQCGFCTPGIIVSIYTHLLGKSGQGKTASVNHIEEHLDGNLCRCTGYRPIWDAARALCDDANDDGIIKGPCGTSCRDCSDRDNCTNERNEEDKAKCCTSSSKDKVKQYKEFLDNIDGTWKTQPDNMFPHDLLAVADDLASKPLIVVNTTSFHAGGTWIKATTFLDLLQLLEDYTGSCKLVVGNTEVGIETRFKNALYPRLIHPSDSIGELYNLALNLSDGNLKIGSCCPLSTIQSESGRLMSAHSDAGVRRTAKPIHDMLRWFASSQIRNVACLGGNLVTASPISDMNPLLASLGAQLTLSSLGPSGAEVIRRVVPASMFFVNYRKVDIHPNEVLECIDVPIAANLFEYVSPFKQARRREDDISIVTSGMKMRLAIKNGKYIIDEISIAYGGVAPTTILAVQSMKVLTGVEFCAKSIEVATGTLLEELKLDEQVPGGAGAYRMTLGASFLYKFFLWSVSELNNDIATIQKARSTNPTAFSDLPGVIPPAPFLNENEISGISNFLSERKPQYYGVQKYPKPRVAMGIEEKQSPGVHVEKSKFDLVGKPSTHVSGPLHCTGEAIYNDDIALPPGTLQAVLVISNECGGVLEDIDPAPALAVPGVVGVYTANDIERLGGVNAWGAIAKDEYVFLPYGEVVRTVGQTLGIVIAESLEVAEAAACFVKVRYSEAVSGKKVVVTIEDAIEANSFYDFSRHTLARGDLSLVQGLCVVPDTVQKPQPGGTVKVSGSFRSGAQEHFYLETNSTVVIPSEADTNLLIYSSTQATGKTQNICAAATGTPYHKVVVRVKRLGGGFGGKETRSIHPASAAAVAAKASNRPVRLTLARDIDMKTTGTRHAFLSKYHASAKLEEDGSLKLVACDIKVYNNGGSAFDLSGPVLDRCLFHIDNCYFFPNSQAQGVCCKTSQAPHTAFRGFGGPQGMAITEHIMDHLSVAGGVPGDKIRRDNFYKNGDIIPFGIIVGEETSGKWNVPTMWDRLYSELNVPERRRIIAEFNTNNKWIKRGLALLPTKFGIAFTAKVSIPIFTNLKLYYLAYIFPQFHSVHESRWSLSSLLPRWNCPH